MKRIIGIVVLALTLSLSMHSFASAIEQREIKKLIVSNAELIVELEECEIDKLYMLQEHLSYELAVLATIKGITTSKTTIADAEREMASTKKIIEGVRMKKKEKLESLHRAKKALASARSL